jgi:hypothetical protein
MTDNILVGAKPILLLIQDDKVVERCFYLEFLRTEKIDEYTGFKVALGYFDRSGVRKVFTVLADVEPLADCDYWCITSGEYDNIIVPCEEYRPAAFVKYVLRDVADKGHLQYPPVLPTPLTIKPDSMQCH